MVKTVVEVKSQKIHMDSHIVPETSNTCEGQQADSSTVDANHTQIKFLEYDKTNPMLCPDSILDLSGILSWSKVYKDETKGLIKESQCILSQHDLDLGKTSLVKHSIKLTDNMPFKERYRCIPPEMYEEVKVHIQEILDIGVIRPSQSPWACPVALARKMNERLHFCIDLKNMLLKNGQTHIYSAQNR